VRLPARHGDEALIVSIFEAPGKNYLRELVEFGPNAYRGIVHRESWDLEAFSLKSGGEIPLHLFLDFAIGAAECCEILHHGNHLVHGEIRGDAFFFDPTTGTVKMVNFGSGTRSFENGLTSAGWYSLSRERGVEHKLQFIAPEQTGRLPAEPDSRTDIYSLGILFGYMLTGVPPFEGDTPLEIIQNVLSRRIPPVSSIRLDIPDALSRIITRMTNKNIEERYASASGLKHDLLQIQKLLSEGDMKGLNNFQIGTRDVSSFFNLPQKLIGRDVERGKLLDIIETVSRRQQFPSLKNKLYSISSNSSVSDARFEPSHLDEATSDSTSSRGSEKVNGGPIGPMLEAARIPSKPIESIADSEPSSTEDFLVRPLHELKSYGESRLGLSSVSSLPSTGKPSNSDSASKLLRTASRMRRKGR
jgi:serine/threonine protein kinase